MTNISRILWFWDFLVPCGESVIWQTSVYPSKHHCTLVLLNRAPFEMLYFWNACLNISFNLITICCENESVKPLSHVPLFVTPMDCNPPGSPIHGILQARILERVDIFFSWGYNQPGDQTQVSCIAARFFTIWATREITYILD